MARWCRMPLAWVLALVLGAGLCVSVSAAPDVAAATQRPAAARHKHKHKSHRLGRPPRPVTIAPGTRVTYHNVRIRRGHAVRVAVLRLDMRNRAIRLDATVPNNAVGAGRQTITRQTAYRHAVGGINADFFDVGTRTGEPKGGLVINGTLLKSPRRDWDANFYVRGGRARIGRLQFAASVTRAERPATPETDSVAATTRIISSVNDVRSLDGDRVVLVTSALAAPKFGRACTVATGVTNGRTGTITAVYPALRSIARRPADGFALVACGTGPRAVWLGKKFAAGDQVTITTTFAGGMPSTLVGGGRVLVAGRRAFNDSDGKTITGRNPESFGCVSASGTTVLLGTIDGRQENTSGVTLRELQAYLLRLHCYSGIVFDGGGSSTLVGRAPGTSRVRVLNRPSDSGRARRVTTGLVLYRV